MNRHVVFLAALGIAALFALRIADADDEGEEPESPLHKLMKAQGKAMKGIKTAMQVKKKKAVQEGASALFEHAKKLPEHVPAELTGEEDRKKFLEFAKGLGEACAKLVEAANAEGGGDAYWNGLRGALGTVGESCQACHDVFAKEEEE